jgi:solute:Na+ symporter, SSS family
MEIRFLDIIVIVIYFGGITLAGLYFARRNKDTEDYFLGGRNFPGWVIGLSMVGTSISSQAFLGTPGDSYRTAYIRMLAAVTFPPAIYIASRWFLPFFRRTKTTSACEYLERRFGPGTRSYAAVIFILGQILRIGTILYLLALLINTLFGIHMVVAIVFAGVFVSFYTVAGGIEAVVWTDVVQTIILVAGGLFCLGYIVWELPGGLGQIFTEGWADGKFNLADTTIDKTVPFLGVDTDFKSIFTYEKTRWDLSLYEKSVPMLLFVTFLTPWLQEYASNQNVIQRFCAAKSAKDARRAMWICCFTSVPIWLYFSFLGTALYVYFKVFPDLDAYNILLGNADRSAEEILPYFVISCLPVGVSGLVIAAVMAAAMSSLDSSINAIATISVVDFYRRHFVKDASETHYLRAARIIAIVASVVMILTAIWFNYIPKHTYLDATIIVGAFLGGGVLAIYLFGFFFKLGDGWAIFWGVSASTLYTLAKLGVRREWWEIRWEWFHTDEYFTGFIVNIILFIIAFLAAALIRARYGDKRDWTNLTVWTQEDTPLD